MDLTPETQAQLNAFLSTLLTSIEATGSFAAEQIPLVAQEIALWGFWSNLIPWLILLVGFLGFGIWALRLWTDGKPFSVGEYSSEPAPKVFLVIGSSLVAIGLGIALLVNSTAGVGFLPQAIKASIAPRLYVIDWLRNK